MASTILIGLPYYHLAEPDAVMGLAFQPTRRRNFMPAKSQSSLLANGFNKLWCLGLNGRKTHGFTHFAMIHADICVNPGWLDILMDELERLQADVVSTVIPLREPSGLTSTAVEDAARKLPVRRVTMREAMRLPETFAAADVADPLRSVLLVNTGLWVCDLRKPWCERHFFEIGDTILKLPDGTFVAATSSEDWNFSRFLHMNGCKVYATRKVQLRHRGPSDHDNCTAWGEWETDEESQRLTENRLYGLRSEEVEVVR